MAGPEKASDILGASDDDFLKMEPPVVVQDEPAKEPKNEEEQVEEPVVEEQTDPASTETDPAKDEDGVVDDGVDDEPKPDEVDPSPKEKTPLEQGKQKTDGNNEVTPGKEKDGVVKDAGKPSSKPDASATPPNFEASYQQLMAPFKANGKTIELKTPEEARQLMQMGANYTRKMQEIAPQRKILQMLENNGLTDPEQLSFMIDVMKKDPEAVKKLLEDAKIDPLEIDTQSKSTYQGGKHVVTDEEANFKTTLADVQASPEGQETIKVIDKTWDATSKQALWNAPKILETINAQRESGIYQMIEEGINRDRVLGKIDPQTPFLEAYRIVGDRLEASGAFAALNKQAPASQVQQPVVVRKAVVKPLDNKAKVSAASPTRSAPRKAGVLVNPLAMSDADFLKMSP